MRAAHLVEKKLRAAQGAHKKFRSPFFGFFALVEGPVVDFLLQGCTCPHFPTCLVGYWLVSSVLVLLQRQDRALLRCNSPLVPVLSTLGKKVAPSAIFPFFLLLPLQTTI